MKGMDGSDLICTPHFMSRPRVYFLRALRGGNDCCFLSTPANMWSFPLTSFSRGLQSESTSPGFRGWKVWAGTTLQLSTWPDTGALCMLSSGSFMRKWGRCSCTQENPDLFTPAALRFLCRLPALLPPGFLVSVSLAD